MVMVEGKVIQTVWALLSALTTALALFPTLPTPQFRVKPDYIFSKGPHHYRTLALDERKHLLLIGGSNWLFKTWLYNINDTEKSFFAERELQPSPDALTKCAYRSHDPEVHCQNHVKLIFSLKDDSLFVCSSNAFSPVVTKLSTETLEVLEGEKPGAGICSDGNGTGVYVEKGNPGGVPTVYTGVTIQEYSRIIYRPELMEEGTNVVYPFMRTMHTDSKWLNEPEFVGSFEEGDYVYFFFREVAVEQINCGTGRAVYSRVARICKNDVGGKHVLKQNWATFVKARLNCSVPGDFPFYFDHIQDVYRVGEEGEESLFYAAFTTGPTGFSGSAVCVFSLGAIDRVLNQGAFKGQATATSAWLPVQPDLVPSPRPGQCVGDTMEISDTVLHFMKSHHLLEESVGAEDAAPLHVLRDTHLTRIVVDTLKDSDNKHSVIFAGTTEGKLMKLLHLKKSEGASPSLAVYQLPSTQPISTIKLLKNEFLYLAQDGGVSQLNPSQCELYRSCSSCTMDPYCAWSNLKQQCLRHREEHSFSVGWVRSEPGTRGGATECEFRSRKGTHLLYPGDSVHLEATGGGAGKGRWFFNNNTLQLISGRHLLTVQGGLVLVNVSSTDSGQYDFYDGRELSHSHRVVVDDVNCQRPRSVEAFLSVYREWCREFQEYKHSMLKWKAWYEGNTQCRQAVDGAKSPFGLADSLAKKWERSSPDQEV